MPRFPKDRFTEWLEAHDFQPVPYAPAAYLGAAPVGWRIELGRSFFVYRIPRETPEILLIVLFERQGKRTGLRSPFADFVKFISLVKQSALPITTIQGHVDAMDGGEDALKSERIAAFYKRYLAANQLTVENDIEWVAGDLRTYTPPLGARPTP